MARVESAEARDDAMSNYVKHQRSQREQVFTGSASQPVGGRMQRQHKLNSSRVADDWSAEDEAAFRKAFGRSSTEAPTGGKK